MIIKNSRAQRRHDAARLKKKRCNHWGYGRQGWRQYCQHRNVNMSPAVAGMVVNTPTPCSCYMCGNPRRNDWGENPLTIQERKALKAYKDGVKEYELRNDWYWWDKNEYYDEYYYKDDPAADWYLRWLYINE